MDGEWVISINIIDAVYLVYQNDFPDYNISL